MSRAVADPAKLSGLQPGFDTQRALIDQPDSTRFI